MGQFGDTNPKGSIPTRFEADAARIELEAAGIPCTVLGVGVAMQGGMEGVQLQVPRELVDAALEILEAS